MFNEISALNILKERFQTGSAEVCLGIGDDCAALRVDADKLLLVSTDSLVEGVHFLMDFFTTTDLAKKAVAVSISDVAAMGGIPKYILSTVGLPKDISEGFVKDLFDGLKVACDKYSLIVLGGNITSSEKLFIDVTVLGEVEEKVLVKRSGAKAGDLVFVTGTPGDSSLGFKVLQNCSRQNNDNLVSRHTSPQPRLDIGRKVAELGLATSMIDISDGLLLDLERITLEQGLGSEIFLEKIPLSRDYLKTVSNYSDEKYRFALSGGEDYELLFTSLKSNRKKVLKLSETIGVRISEIGYVTDQEKIEVYDSSRNKVEIDQRGFIHLS